MMRPSTRANSGAERSGVGNVKCRLALGSARTIHLVMDNLNIHCRKTLTDHFGEEWAIITGIGSLFPTRPSTEVCSRARPGLPNLGLSPACPLWDNQTSGRKGRVAQVDRASAF